MNRISLLEALAARRLIGDGATGTELQRLGLPPGSGGEAWNLERPEPVRALHERYRAAGADLLTTNTFGANRLVLAARRLEARTEAINMAAAQLARSAAGEGAWVLGDVGPCGGLLEPYGDLTAATVREAFREQIGALLRGGVDAILVETMSDPAELALATEAARELGAQVVIATYTFQKSTQGFRTLMGTSVAEAVARALGAGAHVVGANCGTELSLEDYVQLTAELSAAAGAAPVLVQPNAGSPVLEAGQIRYRLGPAGFAAAAPELWAAGARIIGGCCGSTPEHIAQLAAALRADERMQ